MSNFKFHSFSSALAAALVGFFALAHPCVSSAKAGESAATDFSYRLDASDPEADASARLGLASLITLQLESEGFEAAFSVSQLDAVFTRPDFQSAVLLKAGLKLDARSEKTLLGKLIAFENGYLFHGATPGHLPYALFFRGIAREKATELLGRIQQGFASLTIPKERSWLIAKAFAADCPGTYNGAWPSQSRHIGQTLKDFAESPALRNSLGCISGALEGAWATTGGAVIGVAQGTWDLLTSPVQTGKKFWKSANQTWNAVAAFSKDIDGQARKLYANYDRLDPKMKWEIKCQIASSIATGALVSYFTVGAGAPASIAAITAALQRLAQAPKFATAFKIIKAPNTPDAPNPPPNQNPKNAQLNYLALHNAEGKMPDLHDPKVAALVENSLPTYASPTTRPGARAPPAEVNAYYGKILTESLASSFPGVAKENLALIAPSTPPGSGARVFLVKDKASGTLLASMKVQGKEVHGLDEVAMTLGSEQVLTQSAPDVKIVRTLAAGKLQNGEFVLLQTAAKGRDLDGVLHELSTVNTLTAPARRQEVRAQVTRALDNSATMFAKLHQAGQAPGADTAELSTFQKNAHYEIQTMDKRILGQDGAVESLVKHGDLTTAQAERFKKSLQRTRDEYEQLVARNPQLLKPSIVHGDAHGGNVFVAPDGSTSLIDYGSAMWSVGKGGVGVADRANDIGRMVGALRTEAIKNVKSAKVADDLTKRFMRKYMESAGIAEGTEEAKALTTAVRFYESRFYALQASDRDHVKFKAKIEDVPNAQIRKELLDGWMRSLD